MKIFIRVPKKMITVVMICIALLSTNAFAEELSDLIEDEYVEFSEDYDKLLKIQDSSLDSIKEIILNSTVLNSKDDQDKMIKDFDDNLTFLDSRYYKIHVLKNVDFISVLKSDSTFFSNISNDFLWMAPISNSTETKYLISYLKDENNYWQMAGFSELEESKEVEFFTDKEGLIKTISDYGIKNPSVVKFLKSGKYHLNIVYIKEGINEYAIINSTRPEVYNLENDKVYEMNYLKENVGEMITIPLEKKEGISLVSVVLLSVAGLSLIMLIVINLYPSKKSSKS